MMLRVLALSLSLCTPLVALADDSSAHNQLQAMAEANRSLNYTGRFLYQFGAEISTMEVSHAVIDGRQYQRLTHLDGRLVEVIRRGDEVLCLHPDRSLTRLNSQQAGPLALGDRLASDLPEQYNILVDGDGRVAGWIPIVTVIVCGWIRNPACCSNPKSWMGVVSPWSGWNLSLSPCRRSWASTISLCRKLAMKRHWPRWPSLILP